MAFSQTKKTRVAFVEETVEGTLKMPTSGADFLAIQDGFAIDNALTTLDSAELKGSLDAAQSFTGLEEPTISCSHYLRHSGTEAVAPQSGYSKLLKTAYGSETVNATEYVTIVGSTTSIVKVGVGIGANFVVGQALLIKHGAFDYEIAVIKSISGDDLTVLFRLQNAPATGTSLGRAITYLAAQTGFKTLSAHDYRGNQGVYQAVAGSRVSSMTIESTAGEFLNASFELEGIKIFRDPIEITATSKFIDFTDDSGTFAASVSEMVYKSPIELAAAIKSAMDGTASAQTYTVTYSSATGKFTIIGTGVLLSILWNTGANAANTIAPKISFSAASNSTGNAATVGYVGANAIILSSPFTPAFDSPGAPLISKNNRIMIGDATDNTCFSTQNFTYTLETPVTKFGSICASTGVEGTLINSRAVTVELVANFPDYEAKKFDAFVNNTGIQFQYNFGAKLGTNYIPGQSGVIQIKDCTITANNLGDADGIVTMELSLKGYVDSNGSTVTSLNLL